MSGNHSAVKNELRTIHRPAPEDSPSPHFAPRPAGRTTNMLGIALDCAKRGWFVFPLVPKSKRPATIHGKDAATLDEAKIRDWWERQNPNFNVGIATGPSGLCVVDADYGLDDAESAAAWQVQTGLPLTYAVRSGRRSSFGLQLYFRGSVKDGRFELADVSGDIKSAGGYVLAAGCIHPDTGKVYEAVLDVAPATLPTSVIEMARKSRAAATVDDGEPITEARNSRLTSIAGKLRSAGTSATALELVMQQINLDRCPDPLPEEEVSRIVANVSKYQIGEDAPRVLLGSGKAKPESDGDDTSFDFGGQEGGKADDWRSIFHTLEDFDGAPEPKFLIDRFLQEQSITGLIGPARARKSIITVNIIRALLTGEPLFGKLPVTVKPERCVYLCPESGLLSTARRLRNMGLREYVAEDRLLFTSMSNQRVELTDSRIVAASKNAVVFVDTAVRFFKGDENSAGDWKTFGDQCQAMIQAGARAIVLLHHTKKGAEGLTLEGGRGSGDFGAGLSCCWGTTLDNYDDAYKSNSLVKPVKERDFRAESFSLAPSGEDDNFFLRYVEGSENAKVTVGAKAKTEQAQALAFVVANTHMTAENLSAALARQKITYSPTWCRNALRKLKKDAGAGTSSKG